MRIITPFAVLSVLALSATSSHAAPHQRPGLHQPTITLPASLPGPKTLPLANTALKGAGTGSRLLSTYYGQGDATGVFLNVDSTAFYYPNNTTASNSSDINYNW